MSKVAVVSDSNSGITQAEAEALGVTILPMPFFAGDKTYYEDIDLDHEFYQMLTQNTDISTSMPLVENVTDTWDRLLEEYDEIGAYSDVLRAQRFVRDGDHALAGV